MNDVLEIHAFRGLSICVDSEPITKLVSREVEALLVYHEYERCAQPREILTELLWKERLQDLAISNVWEAAGLRSGFHRNTTNCINWQLKLCTSRSIIT